MPIKVICEKRCHLNEPDIFTPVIFCDLCGNKIDNAANGNFQWGQENYSENYNYEQSNTIYFLHKECSRLFSRAERYEKQKAKNTHIGIEGMYGIIKFSDVKMSDELKHFPLYLGRNLNVKINSINPNDNIGYEIDENTYPVDEKIGWVYFITDNDSIIKKIKVGYSNNVYARIKELQTGASSKLKCYGAVKGTKDDEKLAHSLLEEHSSHGEWFVFEKVVETIDYWKHRGRVME